LEDNPVDSAYPIVRVAAVQAICPVNDRVSATDEACRLIAEAAAGGAQLIVFPEGFIPSHPNWFHHHLATGSRASAYNAALFKNAVEIPSNTTARIAAAAKAAKAHVVMGVCEREAGKLGTLFNTQIQFGPDGSILGKHQKLMPSSAERLVHAGGFGDTLGGFASTIGKVTSLICGENNNPLAVFALAAEHPLFHAMSWPPYVSPTAGSMSDIVGIASRNFASVAGCFVISACGVMDQTGLDALEVSDEHRTWLKRPDAMGGSMIIAPGGKILAGPLGNEPGILYTDCDTELCLKRKLARDFTGHYNRADVFQLSVNKTAPEIFRPISGD
jgi:nitrilase